MEKTLKNLAAVLVALIIAASVALAGLPSIEQVVIEEQPVGKYDTEHLVHVFYDGESDARVFAWMPELDAMDASFAQPAHLSLFVPGGTPSGDYLVRIVVSQDDGRDVVYRYISVP